MKWKNSKNDCKERYPDCSCEMCQVRCSGIKNHPECVDFYRCKIDNESCMVNEDTDENEALRECKLHNINKKMKDVVNQINEFSNLVTFSEKITKKFKEQIIPLREELKKLNDEMIRTKSENS